MQKNHCCWLTSAQGPWCIESMSAIRLQMPIHVRDCGYGHRVCLLHQMRWRYCGETELPPSRKTRTTHMGHLVWSDWYCYRLHTSPISVSWRGARGPFAGRTLHLNQDTCVHDSDCRQWTPVHCSAQMNKATRERFKARGPVSPVLKPISTCFLVA